MAGTVFSRVMEKARLRRQPLTTRVSGTKTLWKGIPCRGSGKCRVPSRNEMMYFRNREETQVPREDRVKERKVEDEVGDVGRGQMGEI